MSEQSVENLARTYKRQDPKGLAHLEAVASLLKSWGRDDAVIQGIAWGHDLLEDTFVSEKKIRTAGGEAGDRILAGIKALTFMNIRQRTRNLLPDGSYRMEDAEFDRCKRAFLAGVRQLGGDVLAVKLADRLCTVEALVGHGENEENFNRAVRYMRQAEDMFKGLKSTFGESFANKVEKSKQRVRAKAGDRPFIEKMTRREFTEMMLQYGGDHSDGYYQYTQWENFRKMMEGAVLPDGRRHRFLLLTNMQRTNDGIEKFWSPRDYIACFSYSKYEDVAMWLNYGRKKGYPASAVRIHFDRDAVKAWCAEHAGVTAKEVAHGVYGVLLDPKGGKPSYVDLSTQVESVRFADVAYIIHSKYMTEHHCGNVEYRRKFYHVTEDGLTNWADRVYKAKQEQDDLPIFKKRGWAYEREVRLIVRLKKDFSKKYTRLAVCFDEPFRKLEEDLIEMKGSKKRDRIWRFPLLSGPWFSRGQLDPIVIRGTTFTLADANGSDYGEEIKKGM